MRQFDISVNTILRAPIGTTSFPFLPESTPPGVYRLRSSDRSPALVVTNNGTILYVDQEVIDDMLWQKYIGKKVWESTITTPQFMTDEACIAPVGQKEYRCFFCDATATQVAIREDGGRVTTAHCCDNKLHQTNAKKLATMACPE